ncbi:carbohydrate-binding module family 14 protein [Roseitranquillus sediminis]|nr:carbohydrate-binding module family 14 protein [Roseitranquillus sediminis]MBM9595235.1 hypothetical protein [Roseitranquillus sediminis]
MKLSTLLAALMLAPGIAAAMCSGHSYEMTCVEGQTFDEESRSCVPVTG